MELNHERDGKESRAILTNPEGRKEEDAQLNAKEHEKSSEEASRSSSLSHKCPLMVSRDKEVKNKGKRKKRRGFL